MEQEDRSPQVSKDERNVLQEVSPLIKVKDEDRLKRLQGWLKTALASIKTKKRTKLEQIKRTRTILDSKNPDPPMRAGMSHISVPLLISEHGAIHPAIKRNIFGHKPPVKIKMAGGVKEINGVEVIGPLNRFSAFLDGQLRNSRALDAETTIGTVAATQTADGTGQWAVVVTPPLKEKILVNGEPTPVWKPASVRWTPLRFEDVIYFDGYGTDFYRMPLCGYYVRKTWADIKAWVEHGYYYKDCAKKIDGFYDKEQRDEEDRPPDLRVHDIAELYAAYDIDGDGFLEQIVIDYHEEADVICRISWNRWGQYRPLVAAQYALPAKSCDYLGSGLGVKLDGAQAEASMIHNLGIESGKRGIANILVGRQNTGIDAELGGDETVVPGDYYATNDPKEDLQSVPLGDPRAVEAAIALESVNQSYAVRITGRDEGSQGNVEAGKRVSPKVGVPILREGRIARENATSNLGAAMQEAVFLTIMAWQQHKPEVAFRGILEDDDVPIVESLVFTPSTPDSDIRDRIVVNVVARDVAATEEQRQQKLMLMNQFLSSWYNNIREMLQQIVMTYMNPQTLPFANAMRAIHMEIIEKLRNSVEEMLRMSEEVEDPEEYLLKMDQIKGALDQAAAVAGAVAPQPQQQEIPQLVPAQSTEELGGGVT